MQPRDRRLTKTEERAFGEAYNALVKKCKRYGSKTKKWQNCLRLQDHKKNISVLGHQYTGPQIAWIWHNKRFLPSDGLDLDHICGDPRPNKKSKASRCIAKGHFPQRKDHKCNVGRTPCHNVIRKFYFRIYQHRMKRLAPNQRLTPGPITNADISRSDLSIIYDKTHSVATGKNQKSQEDIDKAARKKENWIEDHSVCPHAVKCIVSFN